MITIATIFESFRSLKDRSYKLTFLTQEITPEKIGELSKGLNEFGVLAFKIDPFKKEEIEILENIKTDFDDNQKTESQRLRAVLYRSWEQNREGYTDFQLYYRFKMNKIIEHYKSKLV